MRFRTLDFETTGFPPVASVVEIGFTDVEMTIEDPSQIPSVIDAAIHPTQTMLCLPSHRIELEAMAVHHITEEMVKGAPPSSLALNRLLEDANAKHVDVWVAHNNEFERKFFNPPDIKWLCTYKCGTHLWPDSPSHKNQVLRYYLELPLEDELSNPPHRAGPDSYTTAHMLIKAIEKAPLDQLLAWTKESVIMRTVPFGKHKGKKWSEVPTDYIQWLLAQATIQPDIKSTCEHWLKERKVTF